MINELKFSLPTDNLPGSLRFINRVKLTDSRLVLACFCIGFFVRLVPELLAFSSPIGFDTIHYAYVLKSGVIAPHWSAFFTSSRLLYVIIVPLFGFLQAEPFLFLKIVAPVLFGMNVAGIYWFSKKFLGWNLKMGLFSAVFFSLQLASLRIGWDLLRNMFGLGILLFALSSVKSVGGKRGFALFTSLSLLTVFAHEYSAVILLSSVLGLVAWKWVKRETEETLKPLILGVLPAFFAFLAGLYFRLCPIQYVVESNVIAASDAANGSSGALFLVDYTRIQTSVDSYGSYSSLVLNVGLLFAVLFLPYLVLVVKGFFKNGVLNLWTAVLLVGAFGCLVIPFSAIEYWHRWMFMLAYPFTFYAVSGLARLQGVFPEKGVNLSRMFSNRTSAVALLLTFGLGSAYLAAPVITAHSGSIGESSIPNILVYFSASPTVPYTDVNDVVRAMNWLSHNMSPTSSVVLQHAFVNWGRLYLDESQMIVEFERNAFAAMSTVAEQGFTRAYFVWWNVPIGWYGVSVPNGFVSVQDFGRLSVYAYEGELSA